MKSSILYLPKYYKGSSVIAKHHLNNCRGMFIVKTDKFETSVETINVNIDVDPLFNDWKDYTQGGHTFMVFTNEAPINYKTNWRSKYGRFATAIFVSTHKNLTIDIALKPYLDNPEFVLGTKYSKMMERLHDQYGGSSILIMENNVRVFGVKNGIYLPSQAWRSHKVAPIDIPGDWHIIKKPRDINWNSKWDYNSDLGFYIYDKGNRKRACTIYDANQHPPVYLNNFDEQDLAWSKLVSLLEQAITNPKQVKKKSLPSIHNFIMPILE